MRSTILAIALCAVASGPAVGQGFFHDEAAWSACAVPIAPLAEDFEGFTMDMSFELAPVAIACGTIVATDPLGFRNFVDTPPLEILGDHNGTNHASCYVNHAQAVTGCPTTPATLIELELTSLAGSFGCNLSGAAGGEIVEMVVLDGGGGVLDMCTVSSNAIDQFLGYISSAVNVKTIRLRASFLVCGTFGEGFGLDDIQVGGANGACPPPPPPTGAGCYDDRDDFIASCGFLTDGEDFECFEVDTPFDVPGGIPIGQRMTIEAFGSYGFRNLIDTEPFEFSDNNGSTHASCFTNSDPPTVEIVVDLGGPTGGFGCTVANALGAEGAEMVAELNGSVVAVCAVMTNAPDQFVGFVGELDAVRLRSVGLIVGGTGEGFGADDFVVCGEGAGAVITTIGGSAGTGDLRFDVRTPAGAPLAGATITLPPTSGSTPEDVAEALADALEAATLAPGVSISAFEDRLAIIAVGHPTIECRVCPGTVACASGTFPPTQTVHGLTFDKTSTTPIGSIECVPAVPNSTCLPASILAVGSTSVADQDVTIIATNVPDGFFGYFFASQTLGFNAQPGNSLGNICVLGNQGRYDAPSQIGQGPVFCLEVGDILVPVNPDPGVTIGANETWYWQAWYRDVGDTNNFSDVVRIDFIP